MQFAAREALRAVLRSVLSGTGFLFIPLVVFSVFWMCLFCVRAMTTGFAAAAQEMWVVAAFLKGAWIIGGLYGRRRMERGCRAE